MLSVGAGLERPPQGETVHVGGVDLVEWREPAVAHVDVLTGPVGRTLLAAAGRQGTGHDNEDAGRDTDQDG